MPRMAMLPQYLVEDNEWVSAGRSEGGMQMCSSYQLKPSVERSAQFGIGHRSVEPGSRAGSAFYMCVRQQPVLSIWVFHMCASMRQVCVVVSNHTKPVTFVGHFAAVTGRCRTPIAVSKSRVLFVLFPERLVCKEALPGLPCRYSWRMDECFPVVCRSVEQSGCAARGYKSDGSSFTASGPGYYLHTDGSMAVHLNTTVWAYVILGGMKYKVIQVMEDGPSIQTPLRSFHSQHQREKTEETFPCNVNLSLDPS